MRRRPTNLVARARRRHGPHCGLTPSIVPARGLRFGKAGVATRPKAFVSVLLYAVAGLGEIPLSANFVPSTHIRCRMTPSLRASATLALAMPARLANFIPQLFSAVAPLSGLVRMMLAAFCNGPRTVNPYLRHLFAGSLFCPWSAQDRHLMGLDEEEADQSEDA